jgi:hypothetical protein
MQTPDNPAELVDVLLAAAQGGASDGRWCESRIELAVVLCSPLTHRGVRQPASKHGLGLDRLLRF